MAHTAYIALGSNLGDRRENLIQALGFLRAHPQMDVECVSSFYETEPVGGPPGQNKYLNAAARVQTTLTPMDLLRALLEVEVQLGRVRSEQYAPRTLDLDLLLYDQEVITLQRGGVSLVVPHPRLEQRLFVLEPLAEIAPHVVHPVRKQTIAALLESLRNAAGQPSSQKDTLSLRGLRALVTGSTSGIGRAIALELAAGGADVIVHGRRSVEAAQEVAGLCRTQDVRSDHLLTDLSIEQNLEPLVDKAWQIWDGLDIWINNAGADTLTGAAAQWSFEEKLRVLWEVDVRATMILARAVGRRMQERGGVILNVGWDQAETGMEGDSGELFAASKGAVMAFSKSLALSLSPRVRVNCLAPGWIRTAWGEHASPAWQQRAETETPLGRWGAPQDAARAARWLVSPAAQFVTGQILRVNGGAVR
ncbi:MAG: 2-amino-4-hydroxy-6-hydroxymethyldihydropteridine diphosphokinase [Gemmataceae bacterium]|nr:2-amino-4-hydroxy-6-hydroxymethyldihydropteridine diphosphokinase [Gemmataceae bacterium]MCI0742618.1 2-amino-4-hydroxy-6-hydroxymethyldihydropteridine diphosphokinase [Gemmataceae bacterium]